MNLQNDYLIYIENIFQLLCLRGFARPADQEQIQKQFFEQINDNIVEIILKHHPNKEIAGQIQEQQQLLTKTQQLKDQEQFGVMLFIPYFKKISNLDIFKKYMIKYHQIFIFCDDSVIRSIKNKIDKLIVESNEENTAVRIDIIHFDNILLNLFNNGHSPFYSVSSAKDLDFYTNKLHANIQHINKIQVNDPLLLYYGFDAGTVITQHSISDTTSGESEKLLLVIKQDPLSIFSSHVLYTK